MNFSPSSNASQEGILIVAVCDQQQSSLGFVGEQYSHLLEQVV